MKKGLRILSLVMALVLCLSLVPVFTTEADAATYYTITFNTDGGSSVASRRVKAGSTLGTYPNSTKYGYNLLGWKIHGAIVTRSSWGQLRATSNMTLTASWTPKAVCITYNANGGTVYGQSQVQHYSDYGARYGDSNYRIINRTFRGFPADPVRAGYTFDGWYTARTGGTKVTANTKITKMNAHTLYAHWTQQKRLSGTQLYSVSKGSGTGRLSVTFRNVSETRTYEIQVATNSSFTSNLKTQTVYSGSTTGIAGWLFTGLTTGQTYYVRIRTVSGSTYSSWSSVKSARI